ncbi:MAG: transcriptional regulator, partial [Allorhizobium sp.]
MLSQIERGEANPTFAVLWSLTQAMEIELSDLICNGTSVAGREEIEVTA